MPATPFYPMPDDATSPDGVVLPNARFEVVIGRFIRADVPGPGERAAPPVLWLDIPHLGHRRIEGATWAPPMLPGHPLALIHLRFATRPAHRRLVAVINFETAEERRHFTHADEARAGASPGTRITPEDWHGATLFGVIFVAPVLGHVAAGSAWHGFLAALLLALPVEMKIRPARAAAIARTRTAYAALLEGLHAAKPYRRPSWTK